MNGCKVLNTNRLPLGLIDFSNIRRRNMVYVDKTELIAKIANQNAPIFLSRPRRFGKSLLVNTLKSLFSKGLSDFKGLAIEYIWHDKIYKVVHLDFSILADSNEYEFKRDFNEIIIQQFGAVNVSKFDELGVRNPSIVFNEIAQSLDNNSVVLLIDEYDAPMTHHIKEHDDLKKITSILNNFFAAIKRYTDKFRLIFITGVTRASHVSIFSAFNNLKDLSLNKEFNPILGFTQDDLVRYFDLYVESAACVLKMEKHDIYKRMKHYYDGFQFSLNAQETLYSPWSVLSFLDSPEEGFKNYWFDSGGTPSIIMNYLKINDAFDFLDYTRRDNCVEVNKISRKYEISDIPINVLLYQTGYLTIRNECAGSAHFILPNTEVEESLLMLYLEENNLMPSLDLKRKMENISNYIDTKNLEAIVDIFNSILNECVSSLSAIFNDERSVRDIIYAALIQIDSLYKIKERETLKGRSDLELVTHKTYMIIEFKRTYPGRGLEASLKNAIDQVRNNRYGLLFSQTHTLYRVAMVISKEKKMILKEFCREVS